MHNSRLYAKDGYCFYDVDEEIYDEEGNVVTEDLKFKRTYYTHIITPLTDIEEINKKYVSIPVECGFEIV